jgi:hypothetical protein
MANENLVQHLQHTAVLHGSDVQHDASDKYGIGF